MINREQIHRTLLEIYFLKLYVHFSALQLLFFRRQIFVFQTFDFVVRFLIDFHERYVYVLFCTFSSLTFPILCVCWARVGHGKLKPRITRNYLQTLWF